MFLSSLFNALSLLHSSFSVSLFSSCFFMFLKSLFFFSDFPSFYFSFFNAFFYFFFLSFIKIIYFCLFTDICLVADIFIVFRIFSLEFNVLFVFASFEHDVEKALEVDLSFRLCSKAQEIH